MLNNEGDEFDAEDRTWIIHRNIDVQRLNNKNIKDLEDKHNAQSVIVETLERLVLQLTKNEVIS